MNNSPMPVSPEKAAAWGRKWSQYHAGRWRVRDSGYHLPKPMAPLQERDWGKPSPRVLPLDNDSVRAPLALERELNDGQQLSVVAGKEGT